MPGRDVPIRERGYCPVMVGPGSAALVAVLALGTLGLGGCQSCSGFANDFADDARGESSPRAAVSLWLSHAEQGYDTDLDHWTASAEAPLVFSSGSSSLTVVEIHAPGSGYLVGGGESC